jgi:hypothetical protein
MELYYGVLLCDTTKFRQYVFTFRRKLLPPTSRPRNQQIPHYRNHYIQNLRVYNSRKKQDFRKLDTGSFRFTRQMQAQVFHGNVNSCFTIQNCPNCAAGSHFKTRLHPSTTHSTVKTFLSFNYWPLCQSDLTSIFMMEAADSFETLVFIN